MDWLRADLENWKGRPASRSLPYREMMQTILTRWLTEPNLACIREPSKLQALPLHEQETLQKFWEEVTNALGKLGKLTRREFSWSWNLTAQKRFHFYFMPLKVGKTYMIDLQSDDFQPLLVLLNSAGKLVPAQNGADITRPGHLEFSPRQSGIYGVAATSNQQRGIGFFTLTLQEVTRPR